MPLSNSELRDVINSYKTSELLFAADAVGLFDLFAERQSWTSAAAAERLGIDADSLHMFIGSLGAIGVLEVGPSNITLAEAFSTLNPGIPASQLPYLRYARDTGRRWAELADCLRDRSVADKHSVNITGATEDQTRNFLGAMNANALPVANYIAENYDFAGRRILDLGAGAGTYGVAIKRQFSDADVTLLDLPGVTPITKQLVDSELPGGCAVISGNYLTEDLRTTAAASDRKYDDVLLMAIVHQHSPDQVRMLLQSARGLLSGGGRLLISSFFTDESGTAPRFSALFGTEMIVMMGNGRTYKTTEMLKLLSEAGFRNTDIVDQVPGPSTLMVAVA
jgi:2-polyprenyl-3-methyl-5-hydroxy-6-metoxy-1,4-benzoquinol methylase